MSFTTRKLMSASGAAGEVLNVEDVFSTYLYTGTEASSQTITNNIDLSGEGGLVWVKARDSAINHVLMDTEQGTGKFLNSNQTYAQQTNAQGIKSFNSNGFTFGTQTGVGWSNDHVYWTFRKAPKFFDVVTWTGDQVQGRSISHNLGSVPGVIITKKLNGAENWVVYHRSNGAGKMLYLNGTNASLNSTAVYPTTPTDSVFYVGNDSAVNGTSSDTYVAYLFAHNDGDGEFGPNADQDIIKCGSLSLDSNGFTTVDVGFEPQWVLVKSYEYQYQWRLLDVQRGANALSGVSTSTGSYRAEALSPSENSAESLDSTYVIAPNATGFSFNAPGLAGAQYDGHVYVAIRRGTKVPESGTEVFTPLTYTADQTSNRVLTTGIVSDAGLFVRRGPATANKALYDRLRGPRSINTDRTFGEDYNANSLAFDSNTGFIVPTGNGNTNPTETGIEQNMVLYAWERAPKYFDVVAYTGIGGNRTLSHNLDAAPEMMWVKSRGNSEDWYVYHKDLGNGSILILNTTSSVFNGMSNVWNNTSPTSSVFTVGPNGKVNLSGDIFIAYLFATLTSISKVGSYTGNGSNQTIDCGFTSGARFILIKRSNSTGDWYVWDTARGIVSGNDPHSSIDNTAVEATSDDSVDPNNSGFIVNQVSATNINVSSAEYIFYAIA